MRNHKLRRPFIIALAIFLLCAVALAIYVTDVTQSTPILNSTSGTNLTSENLTVYPNITSGTSVNNVTDWRLNNISIAVLNMPFEAQHAPANDSNVVLAQYFENARGQISNTTYTDDSSQYGNNGTVSGATYSATGGWIGGAYDFDGVDDYIDKTSFSASPNIPAFSLWFKPAVTVGTSTSCQALVTLRNGSAGDYLYAGIGSCTGSCTNEYITIFHDSAGRNCVTGGSFTAGSWYNLFFRWNGTTYSMYLNDVEQSQSLANSALLSDPNFLRLGIDAWGTQPFNGTLDEVIVYNYTPSIAEKTALYNSAVKVKDVSTFGNNGTLASASSANPYFNATAGHDGAGAYVLDGVNDIITIPGSTMTNGWSAITVSEWVYPNALAVGKSSIASSNGNCVVVIGQDGNNNMSFYLGNGTTYKSAVKNVPTGQWSHIAGTWTSGGNVTICVNGVCYLGMNLGGTICQNETLVIGNDNDAAGRFFNGTIDEVQIYNRSLSAQQILALYNNRTDMIVSQELAAGQNWSACVIPNNGFWDGQTSCSNTLKINTPPTQGTPILNSTYGTNTTSENLTVYPQTVSDADGNAVRNITDWRLNNISIAVLNMPFEGGSTSTWTRDYSLFGNNGTVSGATYSATAGYDGAGAYVFDGTNKNITIANSNSLELGTGDFSVCSWIKRSDAATGSKSIAMKRSSVGQYPGWYFYVSGNKLVGAIFDGSLTYPNNQLVVNGVSTINTNWHHVCFTADRDVNGTLYLDGAYDNSTSISAFDGTVNSSSPLYIGVTEAAAAFFNGTIDEVQIYNRSLSAQQILALYNNHTDRIVSQELSAGQNWSACTTPNDRSEDGNTLCSGSTAVINGVPKVTNLNITPDPSNLTQQLNISFNVTEDQVIDKVWINLTLPNATTLLLNLSNRTRDIFNVTYTSPIVGVYNVTAFANDTVTGFLNNSIKMNFTVDTAPTISDMNVVPNTTVGYYVNISVNVTETFLDIDRVWANITQPNGQSVIRNLSNLTRDIFNVTFKTTVTGTHNVTFFANDTLNFLNNTEKINFTTGSKPEVSTGGSGVGVTTSGNLTFAEFSDIDGTPCSKVTKNCDRQFNENLTGTYWQLKNTGEKLVMCSGYIVGDMPEYLIAPSRFDLDSGKSVNISLNFISLPVGHYSGTFRINCGNREILGLLAPEVTLDIGERIAMGKLSKDNMTTLLGVIGTAVLFAFFGLAKDRKGKKKSDIHYKKKLLSQKKEKEKRPEYD